MTNEELEELEKLTDLSPNQLAELIHAIWLDGFHQGEQDAAWRIQKAMHGAIGDIFIAGEDLVATRLRDVYKKATDSIGRAKQGKAANVAQDEAAREKIRRVFRLVRHIVVRESER